MSGVHALAELIERSSEGWEPAIERAIFDTVDPAAVADRIERFVSERLAPVDHAVFYRAGVGVVAGLVLAGGRQVVVKVHRWNVTVDRLRAVQRVQRHLASTGLPAPRPLWHPEPLGQGIATVEELIAGESADARQPAVRTAMAAALHRFIAVAADLDDVAGIGEPLVMRAIGAPLWHEPHDLRFDFDATAEGAEWIDELADVARRRLQQAGDERVVGHFDWRVENLGFIGSRLAAIYDWDSVFAAPEAVVVGNTAGQFTADWTRGEPDPLPSLQEMRAFIADYEAARGRRFDAGETELLDAANLALCAYGSRCQHSDMRLHPELGGTQETGWIRLLRERGQRGLIS